MSTNVLVITGMHRSGTSLVAHYLSQCGLNIGDNLFNPHISSPDQSCAGHHEDLDFINWHKQVFKRCRIDDDALLISGSELPLTINTAERAAALKLLAHRADWPQWGWKDPRTTLFLAFWHELIAEAKYLFPFRQPLAVVDSIVRRGNEKPIVRKPIIGLRVWTIYNQQILNFAKQHPDSSLLCDIDDLITSSDHLLARLEAMGMDLTPARLEDIFSKKAFHNEPSDKVKKMAVKHPQAVAEAEALYQELQALCKAAA
ncbi:MAG: sulfotransferase [Cyanobacteria bacterium P01_A01_bin.114]